MNRKNRRQKKGHGPAGGTGAAASELESLGNRLVGAGRFAEAARALKKALRAEPGNFRLLADLGGALIRLGRAAEAAAVFSRALEIEPRSVPVLGNLAILKGESGDSAGAAALYRRIFAVDPCDAEAWHDFSLIKKFQAGDPDLAAMLKLRDRPGLDAGPAMFLDFALAKAFDEIGDWDRSFRHAAAANRAKRASLRYDVGRDEAMADRIVRAFDEKLFAAHRGAGLKDARPLFIVGMPRSGTTLVEQILASHSQAVGLGEVNHFRDAALGMAGAGPGIKGLGGTGRDFPEGVLDLEPGDFRRIGRDYARQLGAAAKKARRVTDKMPRNFFFAGLIRLALPEARIVHCVRDPLDTCLSCFQIHFPDGQEFAYDLTDLGRYYRLYARLMDHWRALIGDGILDLRYEDLVTDPEPAMRRLLDFAGLEWEDACLDFHRSDRLVRTASAQQVRRPIYRTAVKRWQRYEKHLGPLIEALGPLAGGD